MPRAEITRAALALIALAVSSTHVSSAQTLKLPAGTITGQTTPGVHISLTNTTSTVSFSVTFAGLPAGLSVANQTYLGWCSGYFGDFFQKTVPTSYTPYSTYDSAHLPANAQSANWDKVNWVLNHKPTGTQSTWIVQQVLWRLLANQYG